MTKEYDELVDVVANAVRLVDLEAKQDAHEYLQGSRDIAKAAIRAIQDWMPEEPSFEMRLIEKDGYQEIDTEHYSWNEFRTMGRQ